MTYFLSEWDVKQNLNSVNHYTVSWDRHKSELSLGYCFYSARRDTSVVTRFALTMIPNNCEAFFYFFELRNWLYTPHFVPQLPTPTKQHFVFINIFIYLFIYLFCFHCWHVRLLRVTLNINQPINQPTNQPTNPVLAMFMELRTDSGSMSTSRAHLHLCYDERSTYILLAGRPRAFHDYLQETIGQ